MGAGKLTCTICGNRFARVGTRGPVPQFCSIRCKGKRDRARPERKQYEREYRRTRRASGLLTEYERSYNRRPEVKERSRKRMMWRWYNDPEYRAKQLARWGDKFPGVVIPAPYTGHRWLDMARKLVKPDLDDSVPWADDYHDEMGEAVLALLEGRDMNQAVKDFRNKEYVARHLTYHMGDWRDDDGQDRWFDRQMPIVASAEDEYLDKEESTEYYIEDRFNDVSTRRRQMRHRTQQPSRRRMNNR